MKRIIEGTCTAYLTDTRGLTPNELMRQEPDVAVTNLTFYKPNANIEGWVKVGTAKITVELDDNNQYVETMVESLEAQKRKIQADAEFQINYLQSQINSLLCLEYIPVV